MAGEGLKKAVLEKARAEAADLIARAQKQKEARLAAAASEAEAKAAETVEKARREASELQRRAVSSVEREVRLGVLKEKNLLLDEVCAKAIEVLKSRDTAALYRKCLDGIDLTGTVIRIAPRDKATFDKLVAGRARIEVDSTIDAGCIVVRDDYRLDRTLKSMLAEYGAELRAELAAMLFGEAQ